MIKEKCGIENYVKQLELAQAVASKLSVTISAGIPEKDVKVVSAAIDSVAIDPEQDSEINFGQREFKILHFLGVAKALLHYNFHCRQNAL